MAELTVDATSLTAAAGEVRRAAGDVEALTPGAELLAAGAACPGGATSAALQAESGRWAGVVTALVSDLDASASALAASARGYDATDSVQAHVFTAVLD